MARYQVGQSTYEIPDNLTPELLEQTLTELAYNEGLAKRQGSFGYGLDQAGLMAGKGTEALGRFIGVKDLEDVGSAYTWVKERDIQQGGYIPTYDKPLSEYVGTGDFFGALWEKSLENAPSGGLALVGTGAAAVAAVYSAPAAVAIGGVTTVGSGLMGAGEAAFEQEEKTGDYDPTTAVGIGALIGLLDRYGAGKVIPKSSLMKMSVGELTQELAEKGYGDAALAVSKRAVKNFAAEGTTEMGQEALSMGGAVLQGGEYTADEVGSRMFEAGVLGGTLGSTTSVGIDATKGVVNAAGNIVPSSAIVGDDQAAAADFARDLQDQIVNNDLNINDLDKQSTKGVRQAVDNLHIRYDEEMKQLIKDLRDRLQIKDGDPRDLVLKKILAKVAYREARNKTKSVVGVEEMQAVMELTGDTSEGQQLASIMRRMNELTNLHNGGYQGGVSRITDSFSPLGSTIGYDKGQASFERLARPIASLGAATINPMIPVGQAAAVGAGRLIDRVTGRRNKVQRYIKGNINNPGVQSPDVPSVREQGRQRELTAQMQQEQEQRDREAMNTNLFLSGAKPTPGSPQDVMEQSTGLDRDGVVRLLTIISRSSGNPALKRAADSAAESVFRGGRVPDLSPLIREMNKRLDNVPDLGVTRVREPIRDYNPEGAQAQPRGATDPRGANYERGIRDNQAAVDELAAAADADDTLSPSDKSVVKTALMAMRKNLGADPASRVRSIYNEAAANLSDPAIAETYMLPYVQRVEAQANAAPEQQQDSDNILDQFPEINQMAVPDIGEGLSVFPKTRKLYKKIDGVDVDQGNYVADGNDVTGVTFDGARIGIDPETGRGRLEVDPKPVKTPSKETGKRWHSNLVRPNLWNWVENSSGLPMSFITTVEQGSQHFYAMNVEADVPTEMYRKPKGDEPTMRPRGFGRVVPGNQIGTIVLKSSGKQHPIYDTVRIEPEGEINLSQEPGLTNSDPFGIGTDIDITSTEVMPTAAEVESMRDGTFERAKKRSLVEAVNLLHDRWRKATGRNEPFEYTPENVDRIARIMATEAVRNLQQDGNAIGWYDRKLKAAKSVMSIVEPRIMESPANEAAFDYALAVTSNGQAVVDNFEYATEVFRYYMDNGVMPTTTFKKGGERNASMLKAFDFFNKYTQSTENMSISEFLDMDTTVSELKSFIKRFNQANGTKLSVPASESAASTVKGSFILGAKIGQGFFQNIRGNYDPLTMDIWWMRMWNRTVGRPFEDMKTDAVMQKNRKRIEEGMKSIKDPEMRKLIKDAFEVSGETRTGLYKDASRFDNYIVQLNKEYQRFFKRYKEVNKKNHEKPDLFKAVGTHIKNLEPQLQAMPKTPGERAYMREATQRAIQLLSTQGYDINTADFQALMWYPEKQLFRVLGVDPGRGSDNDYLDAAKLLAAKEGKSYEQIQEALPDTERDGISNRPSAGRQDGSVRQGTSEVYDGAEGQAVLSQEPTFDRADNGQPQGDTQRSEPNTSVAGSRPANPAELREADGVVKAIFEVGKPGSPFENGIKDIRTVKSIVEAFHHMFIIAKNSAQLKKAFKGSLGSKGFTRGGFEAPLRKPGGSGTVAVLSGDYVNPKNPKQTGGGKNQELWTALHELGHVIEGNFRFGKNRQDQEGVLSSQSYYSPVKGTTVKGGNVYEDTFRQIITSVLGTQSVNSKAGAKKREVSKAIYDEIVGLQRTGLIPGTDMRVRDSYRLFEDMSPELRARNKQRLKDIEATYFQSPEELAADAIAYYLANPQLAKQNMPLTAKLIREAFAKNNTVQFFNLPLGVILAGIIANMAVAMKEDEDEKAALSLGSAALSA
jgi:hypothetical protein